MGKPILVIALFLISIQSKAQLSVVKMVGNNTKDYKPGAGLYLKAGYPISQGDDVTIEVGCYIFSLDDYSFQFATIMTPVKLGYRYTFNRQGNGFYMEPQIGYNIYGLSTLNVDGYPKDFKYHGIVLGAGTGYLFSIWSTPVDLNLHYETILAKGGSYNYIRLGLVVPFSLKKRASIE